jgi:iron(III) transport system substrate-binding protein
MREPRLSRRDVLKTSAILATSLFAEPVRATAPEPTAITSGLIEAARKEGKLIFYTALDVIVAEIFVKSFEAKYSGITVRVERAGSERLFQRIGQEQANRIYAVDVVNSADAAHYIVWKRNNRLAPFVPEDVAKHVAPEHKDKDGTHAAMRAGLIVMGYNTNLVKPEEAPKGFIDLLDPKWMGKIVKAHPGYSGTDLSATHQISRDLGWPYFEKLSKQKIMQLQSANDSPKKLALGERSIMADGNEYTLLRLKDAGNPVEVIYPVEGTPFVTGPSAIFNNAPNPNAARLFQNYAFTLEAQQILVDVGELRSVHTLCKEKTARRPLSSIKLMNEDAAALEAQGDEIKARYSQYFRV